MSDTEDGTDDGFDREAEKERLREKFEKEKADREATQQMSELLLQGATMTNRHCDNCGNPIFRHQGRAFCPVCGAEYADGEHEGQGGAASAADGQAAGQQATDQRPQGETDGQSQRSADQQPPGTAGTGQAEDGQHPASNRRAGSTERPGAGVPERQSTPAQHAHADASGDLNAARASLVRTLTGLTRQAEESRDVGRTRELLAAAREAAETLAALDRPGR